MAMKDLNSITDHMICAWKEPQLFRNIDSSERILSGLAGSMMLASGIRTLFRKPGAGLIKTGVAGLLLYRALVGYCPAKEILEPETDTVLVSI